MKKNIKSKDGINIHYEINTKNTNKQFLFLVHGVGGDLDAWQYAKHKFLEKDFSIIAMDLRGHGESDHPYSFEKYKVNNFIEDVLTILDEEKIDKVILIGHSLGAVLTTHIALHRPERIEKLILVSSSCFPPAYFKIPGIFWLINTLSFFSLPPIYPKHSIYPPGKIHKDIEVFGLIRTIMRNSLRSYLLSSKEILKSNLDKSLKEIKIPTLIISGDRDSVFPIEISKHIHSQINNSQFKTIKGANHVIPLNNTDEMVSIIDSFLNI